LRAALGAGVVVGDVGMIEALVGRCGVETDFFVRDMLTWALTQQPAEVVVPRLVVELGSQVAQARSQALHTLSKIGDKSVWPAITTELLRDADDEVARSAWRAAVILVPDDEKDELAAELASQLGRGDRQVQLSLSQALVALGEVIEPALRSELVSERPEVWAHAKATERLLRDPEAGFELALDEAKRAVALSPEQVKGTAC
jgi:hypothetical protein